MTEKPSSGVRQGGRSLTATSQVTDHRFWQEETGELENGREIQTQERGKMSWNIWDLAQWWANMCTSVPRGSKRRLKDSLQALHSLARFCLSLSLHYIKYSLKYLNSSVRPTLQLRPLWMPVIVSSRSPRPVRRGKGELGTTSPGPSFHPGQAKPGRLGVVSGPRWLEWTLHTTEEDLV